MIYQVIIPIRSGNKISCDEIFEWASQNDINIKYRRIFTRFKAYKNKRKIPYCFIIYFDCPQDAFTFKLRWN